jgi:hypothetical protein
MSSVSSDAETDQTPIFDSFREFSARRDIERIGFVFMNHGSNDELLLPEWEHICIDTLPFFLDDWTKPTLMVLDSCCSSNVATAVLHEFRGSPPIGFLTTGSGATATSAIVLSEDADLVNHPGGEPISDFPSFGIFSSMFMREFLDKIAYTNINPTLKDLPRALQGSEPLRDGFVACFDSQVESVGDFHLRDFFPRPFRSSDKVCGLKIPFCQVLPSRPSNGFIDDIGQMWGKSGDEANFGSVYVNVRRLSGRFVVTKRGYLDDGNALGQRVHHIMTMNRRSRRDRPDHYDVSDIVDHVLASLRSEHGTLPYEREARYVSGSKHEDLIHFIWRRNGRLSRVEMSEVEEMRCYLQDISSEKVHRAIIAARKWLAMSKAASESSDSS